MDIRDLENKMVAVLGFGQEGRATTEYLLKHGIKPVLFDQKPWHEWDAETQEYIKSLGINFIFGPDFLKELAGFDVAFRSPGIPWSKVKGQRSKVQITSQTKWFFEHCPCKIIGVTGTKGKGTTATLISKILQLQAQSLKAKFQIHLVGNIGETQPFEVLDNLKRDDWVIYELSSFQLQDLTQSPHIGVVLMTTSEHLDYHKDTQEYREAKTPIVKYQTAQDFAIVNADFEASVAIGKQGSGNKYYFSRKKQTAPGAFVHDEFVVFVNSSEMETKVLQVSDLKLKGAHNLENVCAAVVAAVCAGCSFEAIKSATLTFTGLKHRLEFVAEKQGIKFYNDSFSTTPETAIAAIKSFTEPEVIIVGGSSKNSDFTELGKTIADAKNIKAIIFIGPEEQRIQQAVESHSVFKGKMFTGAQSMQEIFDQVKSIATSGDIVLLSPACASFGMFKNYKERGEQFKNFAANF
jgi:UDP-N-acetylmuramoylalanine--D-glutamate ligase